MKVYVDIECTSGTAELHKSREGSGMILSPSTGAVRCEVMDAPALPAEATPADVADFAKKNWDHAWNAVGIGQDGRKAGTVKMTAVDHPVVVREYLQTNAFLEPDAADYKDHTLLPGQSVARTTISANVLTLQAVRPL